MMLPTMQMACCISPHKFCMECEIVAICAPLRLMKRKTGVNKTHQSTDIIATRHIFSGTLIN